MSSMSSVHADPRRRERSKRPSQARWAQRDMITITTAESQTTRQSRRSDINQVISSYCCRQRASCFAVQFEILIAMAGGHDHSGEAVSGRLRPPPSSPEGSWCDAQRLTRLCTRLHRPCHCTLRHLVAASSWRTFQQRYTEPHGACASGAAEQQLPRGSRCLWLTLASTGEARLAPCEHNTTAWSLIPQPTLPGWNGCGNNADCCCRERLLLQQQQTGPDAGGVDDVAVALELAVARGRGPAQHAHAHELLQHLEPSAWQLHIPPEQGQPAKHPTMVSQMRRS